MRDVMIDIETLGTEGPVVVTSIAAVLFDIDTGKIKSEFYITIDIQSSLDAGLKVSGSTIQWWMTQDGSTRAKMFESAVDLETALVKFASWFDMLTFGTLENAKKEIKVWGNSARFDLEKIANAYSAIGYPIPWHYRNERCYRTYISDFWKLCEDVENTEAHNPIADCHYQIKKLVKVWAFINRQNDNSMEYNTAITILKDVYENKSPALASTRPRIENLFRRIGEPFTDPPYTFDAAGPQQMPKVDGVEGTPMVIVADFRGNESKILNAQIPTIEIKDSPFNRKELSEEQKKRLNDSIERWSEVSKKSKGHDEQSE